MPARIAIFACLIAGLYFSPSTVATAQGRAGPPLLFAVQSVDGTPTVGRIKALTPDSLTLLTPEELIRRLDDVILLERVVPQTDRPTDEPLPYRLSDTASLKPVKRAAPRLWLANGDRIAVELMTLDDVNITVRVLSVSAQPIWTIPLELVRGYADSERSPHAAAFAGRTMVDQGVNADVLSLTNGDHIVGELQNFKDGTFTIETSTGVIEIPQDGIEAFAMNPELMAIPRQFDERLLTILADGSFLTLTDLQSDESEAEHVRLTAATTYGQAVTIPIGDLHRLYVLNRKTMMLSDLEPVAYEFTPYFSRQWKYAVDTNVAGGPLRVDNREYVHGLGLHSQCRLTYDLDDRYSRFQAKAGIDDGVDHRGQAWLSVFIDGKPRIERLLLKGTDGVKEILVDRLDGAKQLTIVVEFGPFGDVCDHVDLVDPVLVRKAPAQP
ncbi:MAG: NPCBM/NEW2 domain-containing protein [Planctomycetota bacterium]|nr:NPCBM/NEW2 domain-containing protein [Planctomycetota bacterium]MDA1212796.1 NPCBM/NEW2 domain-containing protein [Planctomycetota bacterium]